MIPTRASSLARELACPASPLVIARCGQRSGSEADEGSWLHFEIATRLVNELRAVPPDGGLQPPVVAPDFKIPKHSLWIIDWAVRHVRETVPADWALLVEPELEAEFDRWTLTGHCDVLALSPDGTQFIIIDWKLGYLTVVPAEDNDQVLGYAVLVKRNWPSVTSGSADLCQPRLPDDSDVPRISTAPLDEATLESCVADLDRRKCEALDNARKLSTGPQCKWCVGLKCPAQQQELNNMEIELTDDLLATLKTDPDDETIARLYASARNLSKPLEDLDDLVNERIEARGSLTLPDGRTVRIELSNAGIKVTDPVEFYRRLAELIPDPDKRAGAVNFVMGRTVDILAETLSIPKGGKSGNSARDLFDVSFSPFYEVRTKKVKKVSV